MSTRPASTDAPARHRHLLDPAGLRRAQLVFHLHRFDDDHRLAGRTVSPARDQHADDAAGHRRDDRLLAVGVGAAVGSRRARSDGR